MVKSERTMTKLSDQQQSILEWLLNRFRFAEQNNRQLLEVGFSWRTRTTDKARENSWRASVCRSLARLEKRRLITRIRGRKNVRTVRVKLTREGQRIAEGLT